MLKGLILPLVCVHSLELLPPGRGVLTNYLYVGWVGLVGKPAKSHSSIALSLESMGAVLYVKTNVPQSLMVSNHPTTLLMMADAD